MPASCPSCRSAASADMRFCSQCGYRFPGESSSSVLTSRAVGSSASTVPNRRNVPKTKKKKREKPKERGEKPKDFQVPPAAAGDEAAAIYKRMLAAVRGANKDHDEVVAAFKADCKLYGQGELRARVFYDRLASYFGSELMLEHMIPQLARLIPDDKKRKKLDGLNSQYANCHKENPHEAKTRLHLPYSRSLESACRSAADILGNFFRPDFGADSDRYIPVSFLKRAHGIAFLTVIKAGLLITAKMGTGIVIAKLDDETWSAPSAIGTAGIGGGFEAGGELIEVMIVMGSKNAVKVFHRTQVNVGGGLSVAVGPYGRDALAQAAASRGGFNANYSYSHSRGLFAGISLHGAVITARTEMNSNFYGQKLTPEEILSGTVAQPRAAQCLYEAIDRAMDGIAQFDTSGGGSQRCSSSTGTTEGPCTSCRCEQFVPKAFSKKCKTCAHVHNSVA
ncbi:hypothetical protein BBO99_00008301 [Phytophthora kernoviae]|uniref:Uncharacterized protein n=1 Tax=Phytophthora kernoviae TaxID=325452 RepID=A0A421FKK5_9STRA|nr:hypothetical protein BBI17_008560 [Phytophthora kernoviae]RLN75458.1 hypothetical protein BBO99_00008301 [Phytophthora kernoviae]